LCRCFLHLFDRRWRCLGVLTKNSRSSGNNIADRIKSNTVAIEHNGDPITFLNLQLATNLCWDRDLTFARNDLRYHLSTFHRRMSYVSRLIHRYRPYHYSMLKVLPSDVRRNQRSSTSHVADERHARRTKRLSE